MKIKDDYAHLVVAGSFNMAIFNNLDWIQKFLFPDEKIKSEFSLNPFISTRYTTPDFRLSLINSSLTISILKPDDSAFVKLEELALKITEYLPHTPVTGMGINFLFQSSKDDDLIKIDFPEQEMKALQQEGFEPKAVLMQISGKKDNYLLNKIVSKENENWTFNFNYHFEVKSLLDVREILQPNLFIKFKEDASFLMGKLYNLHL